MEQINCFAFFTLGSALQNCFNLARMPLKLWIDQLRAAQQMLHGMVRGDAKYKFDESADPANALRALLATMDQLYSANPEVTLDDGQVNQLNTALWAFNQALSLEFGRAPIFLVLPHGVYDTRRLINQAATSYEGYADRLPPEAIEDTNNAGRCIAFGLPTAAGFHIARATEAVMKSYMAAYQCVPLKDSQRNWGNYIQALEDKGANNKVLHHLGQLKDLHRNPMVHPEVTLAMPEALSLWAMCVSVIQGMVADMESKRAVPSAPILAMLPPTSGASASSGVSP